MDQQAYDRWWALHVRVALGETLANGDQAFYEAGKTEFDAVDELRHADLGIREARAALAKLEADNAQLRDRNQKLNAEIAALEHALDRKSRQLLGAGE